MKATTAVSEAIVSSLISPNEVDSNFEPANVVDGLYSISRALHHVARAIETLALVSDTPHSKRLSNVSLNKVLDDTLDRLGR